MDNEYNLILDTDSYKASHYKQYPPGTEAMFSYLESRGGTYSRTLFFGLQYILDRYLSHCPSRDDVDEAAAFFNAHGEPFPLEQWRRTVENGYIPLKIRAVPEGTLVPTHNALMTVESTDPTAFWMVTWFETMLMRVWYPTTVATQSWSIRQLILSYLHQSADNPEAEIDFKLHDFGARGVSSYESAGIGGAAHLVNFKGSDTVPGIVCANKYYKSQMAGFSIPAAEHSTITAWGRNRERAAYENMLDQFAGQPFIAVVSDSYDLWNAIRTIWGKSLKDKIIKSGSMLVIRPDSGNPVDIVLKTLQLLEEAFGTTINTKGHKVLNNVRVIQGDGINEGSISEILRRATLNQYSASNIAFGMGGALLQQINRDTQKFAYKCSATKENGLWYGRCKNPITDLGKSSKEGRLDLIKMPDGKFATVFENPRRPITESEMTTVFDNGKLTASWTLEQVRARAKETT